MSFTVECEYEGLKYTSTRTEAEWREYINNVSSETWNNELERIFKFLTDNGRNRWEISNITRQIELQVVRHYHIFPINSFSRDLILETMNEDEREEYYLKWYKIEPDNPRVMKEHIKYLEKQLQEQYDITNKVCDDYDDLDKATAKTINFQERVIKKLKSINRRLKSVDVKIALREWRNNEYCTEPNYQIK